MLVKYRCHADSINHVQADDHTSIPHQLTIGLPEYQDINSDRAQELLKVLFQVLKSEQALNFLFVGRVTFAFVPLFFDTFPATERNAFGYTVAKPCTYLF